MGNKEKWWGYGGKALFLCGGRGVEGGPNKPHSPNNLRLKKSPDIVYFAHERSTHFPDLFKILFPGCAVLD